MTTLMFPDTTVLINFAHINRMDLLARLANGNGCWCASVASECARSARQSDLTALDDAGDIFGDPLRPDPAEYQDTIALRDQLAAPGDAPSKHFGEAETVAIITRRHLNLNCFFVTDDRDAARLASRNGIRVADTWLLLRIAHRRLGLDADVLWGYVQTLQRQGRRPPNEARDRSSFDKWLSA